MRKNKHKYRLLLKRRTFLWLICCACWLLGGSALSHTDQIKNTSPSFYYGQHYDPAQEEYLRLSLILPKRKRPHSSWGKTNPILHVSIANLGIAQQYLAHQEQASYGFNLGLSTLLRRITYPSEEEETSRYLL